MILYSQLSKISFLKNRYVAKFLFVAFLGIHIPLLGLVFFIFYLEQHISPVNLVVIALLLTLIACVFTLLILKKLITPVLKGSKALADYRLNLVVPRLPVNYTDEAGIMLQNIQATIQMNQKLLAQKKQLFDLLTQDVRKQTQQTEVFIKEVIGKSNQDEVKKSATLAMQSIEQQIGLADSFVELLKEETLINAEKIRIKKVNVEMLLHEVKRTFKNKLEAKNIILEYNIHVSDVRLKVNSKLLEQALSYLIENAINSSSKDAKINITVEKVQGHLMIYVRDYGIGFEIGESEKIFTLFNSVHTTGSENRARGIGLYLTRSIIERFGGTIFAESGGLNRGAVYNIDLKMYR